MTVSRSRASISRPMSPVSSTPPICRLRRAAGSSSEVRMDFSPTCGGVPAKPGRGSVLQTWGPYGLLPHLWGSTGEAGEGVGSPDVGAVWISPPLVGEYRRSRGGGRFSRRGAAWISPPLVGEYRRSRGGGRFSRRGEEALTPSPSFAGGLIGSLELARVGPRQVGHVVGVVIPAQQELARVLRQ